MGWGLNGNAVQSKILKTHLYTVRLALRALLLGEIARCVRAISVTVTVTPHICPLTEAFEYLHVRNN
jgi:hypothetical protein